MPRMHARPPMTWGLKVMRGKPTIAPQSTPKARALPPPWDRRRPAGNLLRFFFFPFSSLAGSPLRTLQLDHLQLPPGVPRAQNLFVELADRRPRNLRDERPALRQPPPRDLVAEEAAQGLGVSLSPLLQHHAGEGTFVPGGVGHADHRRLGDVGMPHEMVFKLHRRDPLAAGLDDVLRAIGDLDETQGIDAAHVAGAQPAVVEALRRQVFIIGAGDPGAAHLDLADRLAVPRQLGAGAVGVIDEAHLDAGEDAPRLRAPVRLLAVPGAARRPGQRGDRRRLGHAPALGDPDAGLLLKPFDARAGPAP